MKVLFVLSEVWPFAKAGGLADVGGALPPEIKKKHIDIRVFLPYYRQVKEKDYKIKENIVPPFQISVGMIKNTVKLHQGSYNDVPIYFVDIPEYFDRPNLYVDDSGEGFSDSLEIYAIFNWSVLLSLSKLKWFPDLIHAHDWHTGFLPIWLNHPLIKSVFSQEKIPKIMFTVHNLAYQGIFPLEKLSILGINDDQYINELNLYNQGNPMKAGIALSDVVTTVSPTYAKEIQTEEYGAGLHNILREKKESLYGIINGVDYSIWNPEIDNILPFNYSPSDQAGKKKCKEFLLKKANLPQNMNFPLIGIISRLVHQKGFDLIIPRLRDWLKSYDFYLILIGSGYIKFANELQAIAEEYPERISLTIGYDNKYAHLIEAGSDFFLMPSRYEPCGLNQLYSLKYGTIPIVRATGGLADTIIDFNNNPENGTGFSFENYSEEQLTKTFERALAWYSSQTIESLEKVRKRIMELDYSWKRSAEKYCSLYKELMEK